MSTFLLIFLMSLHDKKRISEYRGAKYEKNFVENFVETIDMLKQIIF